MERPEQVYRIIEQATSELTRIDSWTFGGGTALMLPIDHRERFLLPRRRNAAPRHVRHRVHHENSRRGIPRRALKAFQDKCEAALKVARQVTPQFAGTIMTRPLYREGFCTGAKT